MRKAVYRDLDLRYSSYCLGQERSRRPQKVPAESTLLASRFRALFSQPEALRYERFYAQQHDQEIQKSFYL